MTERAPGNLESLQKATLPAALDECWQAQEEHAASRDRRGWEFCCQQEADGEQPALLQGHRVLWKTSLSSVFPLVPYLEESQLHREAAGMGTAVTDVYSQHVSKGERTQKRASVFEPWSLAQSAQNLVGATQVPGGFQSVQESDLGIRVKRWF